VPELRQKGRPAAVAAAARGKRRGGRRFGQHGNWGGSLGLVKLLGWLAGGERERTHELKAAAVMARWSSGWHAEGEKEGFK
jgi:hypothetical protein